MGQRAWVLRSQLGPTSQKKKIGVNLQKQLTGYLKNFHVNSKKCKNNPLTTENSRCLTEDNLQDQLAS